MCACTCAHALSVSPLLTHPPGVHTHIDVGIIQVLGMAAELLEAPGACEDPQNLEHSVYTYVVCSCMSSTHKHYKTDTKKRVGTEQGKSELRNKETDRFHRLARAAAWHLLSRQAPKQMHQTRHEVPRSRRWTEIV